MRCSVLARNLKVDLGDEITFIGSGLDNSFAAGIVQVVGIFESGIAELDRSMAQINLAYFQEAFAMRQNGHSIAIRAAHIVRPRVLSPHSTRQQGAAYSRLKMQSC